VFTQKKKHVQIPFARKTEEGPRKRTTGKKLQQTSRRMSSWDKLASDEKGKFEWWDAKTGMQIIWENPMKKFILIPVLLSAV